MVMVALHPCLLSRGSVLGRMRGELIRCGKTTTSGGGEDLIISWTAPLKESQWGSSQIWPFINRFTLPVLDFKRQKMRQSGVHVAVMILWSRATRASSFLFSHLTNYEVTPKKYLHTSKYVSNFLLTDFKGCVTKTWNKADTKPTSSLLSNLLEPTKPKINKIMMVFIH